MAELSLVLNSQQILKAVFELDGEHLGLSKLAYWSQAGVCEPSVQWTRERGRDNPRLYNMADLARVRLVVRLRKSGVSMPRVRNILTSVEHALPELLKRKTKAVLTVDGWRGVIVRRPGRADVELPSGQLVLRLSDVIEGNQQTAKRIAAG